MNKILSILIITVISSSCTGPLYITKENIELYRIIENGKVGYIDQKGKIRIEPLYELCTDKYGDPGCTLDFDSESFAIIKRNGQYGLINWKGEVVLPPQFDELIHEAESLYIAKKDNKYGIINSSGDTIVPFIFNTEYYLDPYKIFPSRVKYHSTIYNPMNDSLTLINYDDIAPFLGGEYAEVKKNNKIGLINNRLELVLDTIYQELGYLSSGVINAKIDNKWEYLNLNGENVFSESYEFASEFEDGVATVKKGKYGAIDTSGREILPFDFIYLEYAGENDAGERVFMFCNKEDYYYKEAKCGLINLKGDTILSSQFSEIYYFYDIAEVTLSEYGTSGVINIKTGETIIPFNFDKVEYYEFFLTTLYFSDSEGSQFYGYINHNNKIIWSNNKELLKEKLKTVSIKRS